MIRLVLAVLVLFSGTVQADDGYRLGAGDRLRVTVFNEPDLSGEFELDGSGTFPVALIGPVTALDQSPRALEAKIAGMLADGWLVSPRVSVEVLSYRPFYIIGEVNQPGSYPYRAGLTVLNAAALAGGFTYRADEDDIEISRGDEGARNEFEAAISTVVLPGDVIRVEERLF
ncbi:MAG: polysaccharide biosynthesis/export family protein [Pseudomonadota bacterium]